MPAITSALIFNACIAWLDQRRGGLYALVHGLTCGDLADHSTHAAWLGQQAALTLGMSSR